MEKFNVYEPEDDSYLLLEIVEKYLEKREEDKGLKITEVGIGSGVIISNIAKKYSKNIFSGVDINPDAILSTKNRFDKINTKVEISLHQGNLLEPIKNPQDIVIFNTPYLPCEEGEKFDDLEVIDKAIYGGKQGYEVIEEFINQLPSKLTDAGKCFMLFSNLSNQKYIDDVLDKNLLKYEEVETQGQFFETLIVYEIELSEVMKRVVKKDVKNLRYFTSGKHSRVFRGNLKTKEIIVKIGKAQHLEKEGFFLKKLKGENFISELFYTDNNFVIKEFVDGIRIDDWINNLKNKQEIITVLQNILDVCLRLDKLQINKFEMTNPYKHIFIQEDLSVKFIDFERCIFSESPKNTTQILLYFYRKHNEFKQAEVNISFDKILEISKKYKEGKKSFKIENILE